MKKLDKLHTAPIPKFYVIYVLNLFLHYLHIKREVLINSVLGAVAVGGTIYLHTTHLNR